MNLHEFDVIIVGQEDKTVPYEIEDHERKSIKGSKITYLISEFPETKFDPRPLSGYHIGQSIKDLYKRGGLIIFFADNYEEVEYKTIEIGSDYKRQTGKIIYNNYSFFNHFPSIENKTGIQFEILAVNNILKSAIENHKEGLKYFATFNHPEVRAENYGYKPDPNFVPIIKNGNGEIISFIQKRNELYILVFPQIQNKVDFLKELFSTFLPDLKPSLFPFSTRFKWVESEEYWLPNYSALAKEQQAIEKKYQSKLEDLNIKIQQNIKHNKYLHDLLTSTGYELVNSVEKFLHFLEFTEIRNTDKENPPIKEEDLQVTLDNGLLVIEVKGISGRPKDIDCNQISKIKNRRAEERKTFDVSALTIINHQRYLPPLNREAPPFSNEQENDAKYDKRGLITTWQLFNLYFDITNGLITKQDARQALLQIGLVQFKPSNIELIGIPKEVHYNGKVVVIDIKNQKLKKRDKLYIMKDGRFKESTIVSLKQDNHIVEIADNGEVGIKLDIKVKKDCELWRKK